MARQLAATRPANSRLPHFVVGPIAAAAAAAAPASARLASSARAKPSPGPSPSLSRDANAINVVFAVCTLDESDEEERKSMQSAFPLASLPKEQQGSIDFIGREALLKGAQASSQWDFDVAALVKELERLKCRTLGRLILYANRVTSTQTILYENLSELPSGTVFTCHQQVSGKGRGSNIWTSPPGCLCFTFKRTVSQPALLPYIQYLVSLALVECIREMPGAAHVADSVRLKWPNDIYAGTTGLKIGGVLCQSCSDGRVFNVTIGVGINVSNAEPTTCLNAMAGAGDVPLFRRETVLANFLKKYEEFEQIFQQSGFASFQDRYLKAWLHSGQKLTLAARGDTGEKHVIVRGLSSSGFLLAEDVNTGALYELHPDGNSLDFMKGLVVAKTVGKVPDGIRRTRHLHGRQSKV